MLTGIFGSPWIDLEPLLDLSALGDVHEEVCLALAQLPVDYTGGSHRSMGICPPSLTPEDTRVDYGEAIRRMTTDEFGTFCSLADDPATLADPRLASRRREEHVFGEEREHPLSRRQMLWLKVRFGVYFPWKAYVELIPNRWWDRKADAADKDFTRQARAFFPKTIAFVKSLPFTSIGRCNVMGLEGNDHGTVHRDGVPGEDGSPSHFVTFCPAGNKRLFLWDEDARRKTHVTSRAYWFNDCDYHGVEADPSFRWSVRVDGVFDAAFLERVQRR